MAHNRRGLGRRIHAPQTAPDWVKDAAYVFADAAPMPMGAGKGSPMRDLKGWLARLLAEDVLPRWVDAAAQLCEYKDHERRLNAELFTRSVLRVISDRDRTRSQSVDTTLRRHCSTEPTKGLTFMKILNAICATFDFACCTSRCEPNAEELVTLYDARRWIAHFDRLITAFNAVRICMKNDDASKGLIASITGQNWATTFASLLLKEVHRNCSLEPALHFSQICHYSRGGSTEQRDLSVAIAKAVMNSAPHANGQARVYKTLISTTMENDAICRAALLMPHSQDFAVSIADRAIGLSGPVEGSVIPMEIHREIRIFTHIRRIIHDNRMVSGIMVAFAPVFKCSKPPLQWRPADSEMKHLHDMAMNSHWIALTVLALVDEDEAFRDNNKKKYMEALTRYEMSGQFGDGFGAIHAAKMLISGKPGIPRDPSRAEKFLKLASSHNIRMGTSLLAELYSGKGEPIVKKNETEAARLYQIAVDQGCFRAAYGLAELYRMGAGGLPKDEEKAAELKLTAKAIETIVNEKRRQRRLASSEEKANDVPSICASNGNNSGSDSGSASSSLSPSDFTPGAQEIFPSGLCVAEDMEAGAWSSEDLVEVEFVHNPSTEESTQLPKNEVMAIPEIPPHLSPELFVNDPSVGSAWAGIVDDPFDNLEPELVEYKSNRATRLRSSNEVEVNAEFSTPFKRMRYQAPDEGIGVGAFLR